jgi:hypothetical protein
MRTRLELPIRFRAESHALSLVKIHGLFPIGAQVEKSESSGPCWRVVIYTDQPVAVVKYLAGRMPGIQWTQTENTT